jgi:hypothetical protein
MKMGQSRQDAKLRGGLDLFCQCMPSSTVKDVLAVVRGSGLKSALTTLWFLQRRDGLRQRILRRYDTSSDAEIREVPAFLAAHPSLALRMGTIPPSV